MNNSVNSNNLRLTTLEIDNLMTHLNKLKSYNTTTNPEHIRNLIKKIDFVLKKIIMI